MNKTSTLDLIHGLNPVWLPESIILLGPTGSRAYGTATEDSDEDYKGIVIPPIDYYLGLDSFSEYNNTGGKNYKNTKDDVDLTLMHLTKFVKDAMAGVPNNIEMLFLPIDQFSLLTEEGEQLVKARHLFLSKQIMKKFGGFARGQAMQFKKSRKGRQDLISRHGYDSKAFYHAVRLLLSAVEILSTGDYSTYRKHDASLLLECRNGEYSFDSAIQLLEGLEARLQLAYEHSKLPESPDRVLVNRLLIELNFSILKDCLKSGKLLPTTF